jgi:hypothetical protein
MLRLRLDVIELSTAPEEALADRSNRPRQLGQEFKVIHDNFGAVLNRRQFMIRV